MDMIPVTRNKPVSVARYGLAVVTVGLALFFSMQFIPLSTRMPFALFFVSVSISSLYGGRVPGLLATGLSVVVTAYFILPPKNSMAIGFQGLLLESVFVLVSLVISGLTVRFKRAETSAQLSSAQLTAMLMRLGDAMIVTDEFGCVTFMNPVAQSLTSWNFEDVRGKPFEQIVKIIDSMTRLEIVNPVGKLIGGEGNDRWAADGILIAKNICQARIDIKGTVIRSEKGNLTGLVFVFRDVSREKEAYEKLHFQAHLLDVVNQAMIATDIDGNITYWNQSAETLYGWKAEEVIGRNVVDVVSIDSLREEASDIMSKLRAGETWTGDFFVHDKDGATIPIRTSNAPVYDESGKLIGLVGSSEDISASIRIDEEKARLTMEIDEQRLRLDNIVSSVPGIVWEAWGEPDTSSQRINFVSDFVETMLGYSKEEWLATPNFWLQIVHPEDKERAGREAAGIFASGKGTSQFRMLARDGRVFWLEAQSVTVQDDNGLPVGMRGVTMDITERKRSENALRESEERFHIMADTAPVKIWLSDTDGQFQYVNKRWMAFTGRKIEEELGDGWTTKIHPDDLDRCLNVYETSIAARREFTFEYRLRRHDGEYRWAIFAGVPRRLPDESLIGYIGTCVDITERKLFEEKQAELFAREQSARLQAESANRMKDEFLATLSHELRTPLSAMLGWTWMLRTKSLDDETFQRAVETIDRNVHIQARLIDELLDVSRIITGKLRLEMRLAELVPIIGAAIDTVRPAAIAKEIQLNVELDPAAGSVVCDQTRIQQVAWNLLSNAVKFTPKHGCVEVRLGRSDTQVEISVSDTGLGISAAFLPYVFDRFRQADSSTTRSFGGLGLGLAIVRHLVELHGGSVSARSGGLNQGSTFVVSLPFVPASTEEHSPAVD